MFVYVEIQMYDYIIDVDTLKCIFGNCKVRNKFEYEFVFMKKDDDTNFILTKKTLINQMM